MSQPEQYTPTNAELIAEAEELMARESPLCWSKDYIRLLPLLAARLREAGIIRDAASAYLLELDRMAKAGECIVNEDYERRLREAVWGGNLSSEAKP
jgi:hypothetical protein